MSIGFNTVHDFRMPALKGGEIDLAQIRGKVLLIVNTASQCGFTPQYRDLEVLYRDYRDRGLEVLGVPCNQFGGQEPGDAEEIGRFCEAKYQISFPLTAKVDVNGDLAHPLYRFLKSAAPGVLGTEGIKWNFTKFLVRKDGTVFKRYAPQTKPSELIADIETLLQQ